MKIEVVYKDGVFYPVKPVDLSENTKEKIGIGSKTLIVNKVFGILKGKDTLRLLEELRYGGNIHFLKILTPE